MNFLLILFYFCFLCGGALFYILIRSYKKEMESTVQTTHQYEDILESAFDGFFYEITDGKEILSLSSRRLCLFLNIVDQNISFDQLLACFKPEDSVLLSDSFRLLKEENKTFEINVSSLLGLTHFNVSGRLLPSYDSRQKAFILWFKDISAITEFNLKERQKYDTVLAQRDILTQTLNTLPFPIVVLDSNEEICFSNKSYQKEADENGDMHWLETRLSLMDEQNKYLLKYGQDKTTEEGLKALLADTNRAQLKTFKELSTPIALFDAKTKLIFSNKSFNSLWKLDTSFLKKDSGYEDFLDQIQENGFLPQVKDFSQYKKIQKNLFAQLTKTTEEFLYFPNGQIIRHLMIPYAAGGILIVDEIQNISSEKM